MVVEVLKNKLYLGVPLVSNTQDYAFPSAAMANDDDFSNWIYSNTIQLYYSKKNNKVPFTYFYTGTSNNPLSQIPILQKQYLKSDIIKKNNINIIELIISMIDEGYYFTTSINEYYNPECSAYKKSSCNHGLMVYGYDILNKTLNVAGYDKTLYFNNYDISFNNFELGFHNTGSNIGCQSFKKNNLSYEFDLKLVKKLLNDYVYSKNTSEDLRILQNPLNNCIFGISVYSNIDLDNNSLDYRIFHLIYEHKYLMINRLKKINDILNMDKINEITQEYEKLVDKSKILLHLCLKYNLTQDKSILLKIKLNLANLVKEDGCLILNLIDCL